MASQALRVKQLVPWWAKIAVKLVAANTAISYRGLRSLSLSKFGGMEKPEWAWDTFRRHYELANFAQPGQAFSILELGPGDSLFTALIARVHGASRACLVDCGPFANLDFSIYQNLIAFLRFKGFDVSEYESCVSTEELLDCCHAAYGAQGLRSLREIPDGSMDFIFSNAVLQLVRRSELLDTLKELRRVLAPGGICSHSIGVWDHLNHALNHLRFSGRVWESKWVARSGFYTNRYRFSELLELFRLAGFESEVTEVNRWDRLPTPLARLQPEYRGLPMEDLLVYSFNVLLRPA